MDDKGEQIRKEFLKKSGSTLSIQELSKLIEHLPDGMVLQIEFFDEAGEEDGKRQTV